MRVDVITILPDYLAPLNLSLLGKAVRTGLVDLHVHDLREATTDRHRTVDDTPVGGGAGMVMTPEPWAVTLERVLDSQPRLEGELEGDNGAFTGDHETLDSDAAAPKPLLLVPSPSGRVLDQALALELAAEPQLVFACARYEGIDERVYDWAAGRARVMPISIGDYVLFGGEAAALVILEAVIRLLPGVLGNPDSLAEESHTGGLLEYPLYTKPALWRGLAVPEVLLSGNHAAIADWRSDQRRRRTAQRRPDLLPAAGATTLTDLLGQTPQGEPGVDVEVRPAVEADAGELLTLQRACWLDEALANPDVEIPALGESLDDVREGLRVWRTIVVRVGGRLIASARGRSSADGLTWHVGRLMVAPDLRGRGLGRWLLHAAEDLAPAQVTTFDLFTGAGSAANQRRYRRAGYRRVRERAPAGAVRMRRPR